jgi:tetratricopeptide (TPR) repeat protein
MRRKFRVNQSDLEATNMTRAYISMMESGKRNVSKASSKVLAEKFNKIAERISVNLKLDDEYFSRTPSEDAQYYCENELLKDNSHRQLEELIGIEKKFNLYGLLAETYKVNGSKYFVENDYIRAFANLSNALGKYKELRDDTSQIEVYLLMGRCKNRRCEYDDAIYYLNKGLSYAEMLEDRKSYLEISNYLAIAYGQSKDYDNCLSVLENNILKNEDTANEQLVLNAEVMKANVYYDTGREVEAVALYFKLMDKIGKANESMLGLLCNNVAEYFYKTENYKDALMYIKKAQQIKSKYNKAALPITLNTKAKIFFNQKYYDESIMLFELSIGLAQEYKQYDMLFESYQDLVTLCEEINDKKKINVYMNEFLSILEENQLEIGKTFALCKLAQVSIKQGDCDTSISLLNQLEELVVKQAQTIVKK